MPKLRLGTYVPEAQLPVKPAFAELTRGAAVAYHDAASCHRATSSSNPYQTPQFAQTEIAAAAVIDREKLRRIAKYQQWVLYALLVNIVINIVALATQGQGVGIALAVLAAVAAIVIFAMVAVFLLANELFNPVVGVLCAILMVIPCISLLTLLVINGRATKHLQAHGIKVGFMGANPNTI